MQFGDKLPKKYTGLAQYGYKSLYYIKKGQIVKNLSLILEVYELQSKHELHKEYIDGCYKHLWKTSSGLDPEIDEWILIGLLSGT